MKQRFEKSIALKKVGLGNQAMEYCAQLIEGEVVDWEAMERDAKEFYQSSPTDAQF